MFVKGHDLLLSVFTALVSHWYISSVFANHRPSFHTLLIQLKVSHLHVFPPQCCSHYTAYQVMAQKNLKYRLSLSVCDFDDCFQRPEIWFACNPVCTLVTVFAFNMLSLSLVAFRLPSESPSLSLILLWRCEQCFYIFYELWLPLHKDGATVMKCLGKYSDTAQCTWSVMYLSSALNI